MILRVVHVVHVFVELVLFLELIVCADDVFVRAADFFLVAQGRWPWNLLRRQRSKADTIPLGHTTVTWLDWYSRVPEPDNLDSTARTVEP